MLKQGGLAWQRTHSICRHEGLIHSFSFLKKHTIIFYFCQVRSAESHSILHTTPLTMYQIISQQKVQARPSRDRSNKKGLQNSSNNKLLETYLNTQFDQ